MTAAPALGMPRNRVVVVVGSTVAVIGLVISSLTLGEVGSTTLPWVLSTIPMLLVGSLLVWRVPENRVGWILFGIVVAASGTSLSAIESQPWLNAGAIAVNTAAISLLALLLLAFPDGQLLSDTPPRYAVEGCPQRLLEQSNRDHGLRIDSDTGACRWDGVPMDAAQAVECALMAGNEFEY